MRQRTVVLILLLILCCTDRDSHYVHARGLAKDDTGILFGSRPTCWVYRDEFRLGSYGTVQNRVIRGGGVCMPSDEVETCDRLGLDDTQLDIKCEVCDVPLEFCCYATNTTRSFGIFKRVHEEPPRRCYRSPPGPTPTLSLSTITSLTDKPTEASTGMTATSSWLPETTITATPQPTAVTVSTTPSHLTTTGTVPNTQPAPPMTTLSILPPTVNFTLTTDRHTTAPTDATVPVTTHASNITAKPYNDTIPNPPLPFHPMCGEAAWPGYDRYGGCFVADIGYYTPPSCGSSQWKSATSVGVIINATMVLTVSAFVLRDPQTRQVENSLAVRVSTGLAYYNGPDATQYIWVKRLFFQEDDLPTTVRSPERQFVFLELYGPIKMARFCPVCFSDRRKDIPLSDATYYLNRAYSGVCELYGREARTRVSGQTESGPLSKSHDPWDIRSCNKKHAEITEPSHPRYLRGPSPTGFCAGGTGRASWCVVNRGAPLMCRDNATAPFRLVGLQVETSCGNENYGAIIEDVIDTSTLRWIKRVTDGNATSISTLLSCRLPGV